MVSFYFGANFKMHQVPVQTRHYIREVKKGIAELRWIADFQIWITPPFTSLEAAVEEADNALLIGAQNIHWAEEGAYTGEISAAMVKACGARFVMLGHAERRMMFGETEEQINRKVLAALRHDLCVMLCVGEPRSAYEAGASHAYVAYQLRAALHGVSCPDNLWILYEPMWSVGPGGRPADPQHVIFSLDSIRRVLIQRFGSEGRFVPLLYGGSVDESNCAEYAAISTIAGIGVGRAGLDAQRFLSIFHTAFRVWRTVSRTG